VTKAIIALLRALGAGQVSAQTGLVDDSAKAEGGAFAVEPLHTRAHNYPRLAAFKGYMSLQPTRHRGKYAA
jgi:hypothetical protein